MSADNWATCPQCQRNALAAVREKRRKAEEAYGKVPEDEYLRLKEEAKEPYVFNDSSLREDYEIWIDVETVVFKVTYSAHCDVCGFSFKYKHEQPVERKTK